FPAAEHRPPLRHHALLEGPVGRADFLGAEQRRIAARFGAAAQSQRAAEQKNCDPTMLRHPQAHFPGKCTHQDFSLTDSAGWNSLRTSFSSITGLTRLSSTSAWSP